tara:strand:+ start:1466 stop:1855 length:390 start_codon:yes stop_codon:yes gene_type:complete
MTDENLIEEHEAVDQAIEQIGCFGTNDLHWRNALEDELYDRGYQRENKVEWWRPDNYEEDVCPKCEEQMEENNDGTEIVCECGFKRRIFPEPEPEPDYKKGYHILTKYFDSISDEEKPKVDALLKECGL